MNPSIINVPAVVMKHRETNWSAKSTPIVTTDPMVGVWAGMTVLIEGQLIAVANTHVRPTPIVRPIKRASAMVSTVGLAVCRRTVEPARVVRRESALFLSVMAVVRAPS